MCFDSLIYFEEIVRLILKSVFPVNIRCLSYYPIQIYIYILLYDTTLTEKVENAEKLKRVRIARLATGNVKGESEKRAINEILQIFVKNEITKKKMLYHMQDLAIHSFFLTHLVCKLRVQEEKY